MIEKFIET